jgi:beta-alanine degradation protein BauB
MPNIPDVMTVGENGYNLLMENDRVRVMEVRLQPGQTSPMHNHPSDHVVYVLKGANLKLSFPDATTAEFTLAEGQVLWIEAGPHETQNIGSGDAHNLVIELKK